MCGVFNISHGSLVFVVLWDYLYTWWCCVSCFPFCSHYTRFDYSET